MEIRRIALPADTDVRNLLDEITSPGQENPKAIFETRQKALMFAAALGYWRGKRTPYAGRESGTSLRLDIFERAVDDAFLFMLAITETGDLKVLDEKRSDEVATVFEEYAYTGLLELRQKQLASGAELIDVIIDLINSARESDSNQSIPEGLDQRAFSLLAGL